MQKPYRRMFSWAQHGLLTSASRTEKNGQSSATLEMKQKHPDHYALIAGYRVTDEASGKAGEPCFSSEGLVRESVAYLGMRFGEYTLYMPALLKPAPARLLVLSSS